MPDAAPVGSVSAGWWELPWVCPLESLGDYNASGLLSAGKCVGFMLYGMETTFMG